MDAVAKRQGRWRYAARVLVAMAFLLAVSPARAITATTHLVPGTDGLSDVGCPTAVTCEAVGFHVTGFDLAGLLVPITNGTPGPARLMAGVQLPGGMSCPSPSVCEAIGFDASFQNVLVTIVDGVPSAPRVLYPATGLLTTVACPTASTCVAVGVDTSPNEPGLVVPIVNGVPGAPQLVPSAFELFDVACTTSTTCVAAGFGASAQVGALVPIVNGTAGVARSVPGTAFLTGIDCASATTCEAVGVTSARDQGAAVPIVDGRPGPAQLVPGTSLNDVACPTPTTCEATGSAGPGNAPRGVVVPITGGIAGAPQEVANTASLAGLACPGATICEAGGSSPGGVGTVTTINTFRCASTITGDHPGTLVVRAASTCLSGAHLTGGVVVRPGASLDIEDSTIAGSIVATGPEVVRVCGSTVGGSFSVRDATSFVLIGDPTDDACPTNSIGGSLLLRGNSHGLEVIGNHVAGGLTATGNSGAGPFPEDTGPDVSGNGR